MKGRDPADIARVRDGLEERHCIACGAWKPQRDFARIGIRWRSKCRDCTRAYNAGRPRKH